MASRVPMQQEGLALQALSVALQHPAVATDQGNICTLLQVNKPCRAAVEQSASTTEISFPRYISGSELGRLAGMTAWLSEHAGLVSSLKIGANLDPDEYRQLYCGSYGDYGGPTVQAAGRQLVEFALKAAAAAAAYGSGPPLQLRSFTCTLPTSTGLLAALPASTLTTLDIRIGPSDRHGAVSRLSNLRQLALNMNEVTADESARCCILGKYICAAGNLKGLTQLKLHAISIDSNMQLLPAQLQQLELDYTREYYRSYQMSDAVISLQHMTGLQHLSLKVGSLAAGSSVPCGLESLVIDAQWTADSLLDFCSLQQITSVVLVNEITNKDHCAALQRLRQLKELSLTVSDPEDVSQNLLEVAAAWHSLCLPLCYLKLETESLTATQVQQLMQHVAAATMLTKLFLSVRTVSGARESRLAICEHLRPLRHLGSLEFSVGEFCDYVEQDAQHLSALVALTELKLCRYSSGPYLDAAILSSLAASLTNLRGLSVDVSHHHRYDEPEIDFISALPVIGKLTALEYLGLYGFSGSYFSTGLEFLTGLCRLTALEGFNSYTLDDLESFWDTIKGRQQRHARSPARLLTSRTSRSDLSESPTGRAASWL